MCGAADFLAAQPGVRGPRASARSASASAAACPCGPPRAAPTSTAAVSYYYVMPHGKPDFTKLKGPVLGHFGTGDEFIPLETRKELEAEIREAGVDVTFHYYEGAGHAFFNDTNRLGTYDPTHTQASWERTRELPALRAQLLRRAPGTGRASTRRAGLAAAPARSAQRGARFRKRCGGMDRDYELQTHRAEDRHWWYRGRRTVLERGAERPRAARRRAHPRRRLR